MQERGKRVIPEGAAESSSKKPAHVVWGRHFAPLFHSGNEIPGSGLQLSLDRCKQYGDTSRLNLLCRSPCCLLCPFN